MDGQGGSHESQRAIFDRSRVSRNSTVKLFAIIIDGTTSRSPSPMSRAANGNIRNREPATGSSGLACPREVELGWGGCDATSVRTEASHTLLEATARYPRAAAECHDGCYDQEYLLALGRLSAWTPFAPRSATISSFGHHLSERFGSRQPDGRA